MKFSCCSTRTHSVRKNYRIIFMIRRPRPFVNPAKSAKISKTLPPARQPMRSMLTNIFICRIMPDSMPFSGILTAKVQTFGSLSTFVTVQYLHTYRNLPRSFPSDAWQITGRIIYQKTFVRKQIPIPLLYEGLFFISYFSASSSSSSFSNPRRLNTISYPSLP